MPRRGSAVAVIVIVACLIVLGLTSGPPGRFARQVAEGVTTRAMKAKLLEDAGHYDRLAARPTARRKKLQASRRDR